MFDAAALTNELYSPLVRELVLPETFVESEFSKVQQMAKYSIADGAVEAKDIIAISAMNRIGLSRETLAQKDANVESVTEYLELLYADDNSVKRNYVRPTGWAAKLPEAELVPRTWMLSLQVAIDEKKLASGQDANINRNMKRVNQSLAVIDAAHRSDELQPQSLQLAISNLRDLHQSLTAFQPIDSGGAEVTELVALRDQYLSLVADRVGELVVLGNALTVPETSAR